MMAFTFFTLGGMQFWEDLLFYQNWRIQRSFFTKKCRLLDNWDICRHKGSFEACRNALSHYLEIYQISKPKPHLTILLHGLGGTKGGFKKMALELENAGYPCAAINYPSTRAGIKTHAAQIGTLLNNLEGIREVSFVTYGIGGIIVREMLGSESKKKPAISVKKIVQINPPNREYKLLNKLSEYWILRRIMGPMLSQYDAKFLAGIPRFPKEAVFGILRTHNSLLDRIVDFAPKSLQHLVFKKEDAFLSGAKDAINMKILKSNPCADKKVIHSTLNFFKKGIF